MITKAVTVPLDDRRSISAVIDRPDECSPGKTAALVLAHGMNNDLNHPLLETVAHHLAGHGIASVIRFNFAYRERGSSSPDRSEALELAFRRAHDVLVDDDECRPGAVFLGGKSLGARIAAELASRGHEAEGLLAAGLVFLGYPLHAPGKKDRPRVEPLRRIGIPSLFVEGTRDPFCDLKLLRPLIEGLDHPGTLVEIDGGGHSYERGRDKDSDLEETYERVGRIVADFMSRHCGGPGSQRGSSQGGQA
jgi:uncharacterized protein